MSYSKAGIKTLSLICLLALVAPGAQAWIFSRSDSGPVPETTGCYRQRVAVCVGINRYQSHPQLNCAENDAAEMARVFREFGFDNVVLLRGREATRDAILSTLNEVKGSLSADDLFVFYFAGHGMTVRGGGSKLTGYLLPVNCRSRHEARDGISMASLKDLADTMPSRHSLFLMDACYSGFGLSEGVSRSAAGAAGDGSPSSCVQILTAGGELDRAFEVDGHGLFTGFILNSLEDIARKGKGGISCRQLASVVKKQVAEQTGGWQTPQFGFAGDGDIRLVKLQAKPGEAVAMAN